MASTLVLSRPLDAIATARKTFGVLVCLALVVMVLDDVSTIVGAAMGLGEANPMVLWFRQQVGVVTAQLVFDMLRLVALVMACRFFGGGSRRLSVISFVCVGWFVLCAGLVVVGNWRMVLS